MASQSVVNISGLKRVAGPFVVPIQISAGTSQNVADNATLISTAARFRLLEFAAGSDTATVLTWSSNAAGDSITGGYPVAANSGVTDFSSAYAIAVCDANEDLYLLSSASATVGGRCVYDQVV